MRIIVQSADQRINSKGLGDVTILARASPDQTRGPNRALDQFPQVQLELVQPCTRLRTSLQDLNSQRRRYHVEPL